MLNQGRIKGLLPMLGLAALAFVACDKKKDAADPNQHPPGDTGSGQDNGNGNGSGNGPGGDGQQGPGGAPMTVAGTLTLSTLRLTGGDVSSVVAVSADGDRIEGTFDAATGAFSVKLAKDADKNYVVVMLDETKTGPDMIVATAASDNLSTISVNAEAADTLDLGDLAVTAAAEDDELGTAKIADEAAVTQALGISAADAVVYGKYDAAAAKAANLDVDGDGKVDAKGDYALDLRFGFSSEVDPNQAQNTIAKYKNTYLADDVVFAKGRYSIAVRAKKSLFTAVPDKVVWTFSDAVDLDDSGTDITVNGVTKSSWKETIAADTAIERGFSVPNDPHQQSDSYEFFLTVGSTPKGTYKAVVGGKTLVFTGVDVKGYNEAPPVVPFIKFNVDSDDHITGVDYKWMARKADGSGWEKATAKLVAMFVGKAGGHFSMYVMNGQQRTQKRLEWKFGPDSLEGSIAFSAGDGCLAEVGEGVQDSCAMGADSRLRVSGFSSIEEARLTAFATWGWNNFTFLDKLEMMVSVN